MRKFFLLAFLFIALRASSQTPTPRQQFPGLFEAVQTSTIFPDNKTFVDAVPRQDPALIMKAYNEQKDKAGFNLQAFVLANFDVPVSHNNFQTDISAGIRKHIDTLWQVLQRRPDEAKPYSSAVALPNPYIVPGGRFREVYYWDSYFTMLGLMESHQNKVIHNMVENFAYLIDKYGFIPNGNRSYYLTRSQPPFFAMMVNLLAKIEGEKVLVHFRPQLIKEYEYWMQGWETIGADGAAHRVVKMPDGGLLNRYWDDSDQPREESYIKDVDAAKESQQQPAQFYRNIRAAAASGWDFSTRWFDASGKLPTIQTIDIVPVDLNCLMYNLEITIARSLNQIQNAKLAKMYRYRANRRKSAILKYCWNQKTGWFDDYNWRLKKQSAVETLAGEFPLEFKIASDEQARLVADGLKNNFLKPGGLVTTPNFSGQQWDAPNGWAPLQYMAIDGLEKYNYNTLAKEIATRWLKLNIRVFKQTGKLLEKYNVVDTQLTAGGGEYPLQDGFGWTNGVLLHLVNRYHIDTEQLEKTPAEVQN
ncbi:alpha,alpha-trehalase TreA [Mucilaginibacter sp. SMC90]|uniref:alpha,alpha-trehalase TreA n=1 Tax=Mucilaginibacter sp. SMC90 TaxID=2929803 RepID=UPI001FB449AB|nr:alpha,alpha-trehalase TreA [Mucilaginibacter sp. SMC90]UOE52361.1 alpha,alpha-trehalase TreA [Mucilaginibacter sp. SMC90]